MEVSSRVDGGVHKKAAGMREAEAAAAGTAGKQYDQRRRHLLSLPLALTPRPTVRCSYLAMCVTVSVCVCESEGACEGL